MPNAFDQFDSDNPFNQFDSTTTSPLASEEVTDTDIATSSKTSTESPEDDIFEGLPPETVEQIRRSSLRTVNRRGRPLKAPVLNRATALKKAQLERLRLKNPYLAQQIEETGGIEAFLVGAGEGFHSLGRGVGLVDKKSGMDPETFEALKQQKGAATGGKILAQTSPFLIPGGAAANIASTPARIAAMGGLGAVEGNIIARGEGGDANQIAKATGMGLLIGTFGEAALPVVNSLGRKFVRGLKKGKVSDDVLNKVSVDAGGNPSPEFQKILDESGVEFDDFAKGAAQGFDDPVMNAQRKRVFDEMGLDITEAQRTRDADLFNLQQDAIRREGPVKTALERQEEILDQTMKGEIAGIGGIPQRANASPIEAITDKATQLDDEISDLYRLAREQAPEDKVIKFNKAIENLRSNAPQDQMSNGTVRALSMRMRDMGVMNDEWKAIGKVDLNTSEELRKFANRIYKNANPEGREIIRQFKNSLDDDVFKSIDEIEDFDPNNWYYHATESEDLNKILKKGLYDKYGRKEGIYFGETIEDVEWGVEIEDRPFLFRINKKLMDEMGVIRREGFEVEQGIEINPGEISAQFDIPPSIMEVKSGEKWYSLSDISPFVKKNKKISPFKLEKIISKNNIPANKTEYFKTEYFKKARKAKADFERGLDVDSINKWDKSKTSLVRDILSTVIEEDDLVKRVLSRGSRYKARHLQELKNYLSTGTEGQVAQGVSAWNDIRAAALQQIKDESFTGPLTKTGTQSLSRSKLEGAIKKIGPAKMEVLFSPKERNFLKKLMAVATLKEPPPGTFMGSGPSSPAIKELSNIIKRKIPIFGDVYDSVSVHMQNKATDRKLLELIDDAKIMVEQNDKLLFQKLRKSKAGIATATVPTAAITSVAAEEED